MKYIALLALTMTLGVASGQNFGSLTGTVRDKNTQRPIPYATIMLINTDTLRTASADNGSFSIKPAVGRYNIQINALGYQKNFLYNININSGNPQLLEIELDANTETLDEIVIGLRKTARATDMVTPLSTQKLTAEEIKSNPGGNFDVSKVIQVLPGVAGGTSANRNDIIVRGGGPAENVYYLDGIEIPVLNHFQTQGASGGATGILNLSFINDVQLTSSAFDSRYDNALASTFVIKQRDGNPDKLSGNVRLSGSELAATLEGPLSNKTTFMASARRSYLQFLFQLLDIPIRPDYWDFQYKIKHRFNEKTELTFIGLGAIDNFRLEEPKESDAEKAYIVRSNPLLKQWNYTAGASLKRLTENGFYTVALSRNMLSNSATRYENNATAAGAKLFNLNSDEIENKLRIDFNTVKDGWKLGYGLSAQYVVYNADLFNTIRQAAADANGNITTPAVTVSTGSAIDFFKTGAYFHSSKYFLNERLLFSGGMRSDINTWTAGGTNPLRTLSPRVSFSYAIDPTWNISTSVGSYYKLPVYTALGYRDDSNSFVNKDLKYINSIHYTVGVQYIPRNDFRFTLETFYKDYSNYPVSLTDGISMANIGTDFSAVGNDSYISSGDGRVYGVEAYVQQKLIRDLFYVASATVYRSEFAGMDGIFTPSTWDYGYIISTTLGYKFKRNWDIGLKYRLAGGQPYTPFDMDRSRADYLTLGRGVYDYRRLNDERLPLYQQLDIRVDKKYNFRNTSLILFADIQNALLYKTPSLPKFTFERTADNLGYQTSDGTPLKNDGSNGIPLILSDRSATVVPSLGFIWEF